jgi:hypothetical protein
LSACASDVSLAALEAPVLKLWRELSPDSLIVAWLRALLPAI